MFGNDFFFTEKYVNASVAQMLVLEQKKLEDAFARALRTVGKSSIIL